MLVNVLPSASYANSYNFCNYFMFIILDLVMIWILLIFLILTGIFNDDDVAVFVAVM